MQDVLELSADHLTEARLFANRVDALAALPRGGKIAEIGVAFGNFSEVLLERLRPAEFDAYDTFWLHDVEGSRLRLAPSTTFQFRETSVSR